jgi:hypothetical protein
MVLHRLQGLPMLVGVLQDLLAGHDAALHFIQDGMPSELDQRASFLARVCGSKRLSTGLPGGHLLALQHATACLSDHPLDQWQHLCRLAE